MRDRELKGRSLARERYVTQLYWLLVVKGPLTMNAIVAWTNWTTPETNNRLNALRRQGCVRLIERGQHQAPYNRCGKWQAITEVELNAKLVAAETVPA